jgi:TPR repeat protein
MSFIAQIDIATALPVELMLPPVELNPDSLFDLGLKYSSGCAGVVDLVAAHKWFNLAAVKGRRDAVSLRQEVAAMMSESEIAMAQRDARAWMSTH